METESAIVFSGIAPHPPIMVPEVGGESIAQVRGSIAAMAEFTGRLIDSHAQTVILISPHAPLQPDSFVAYRSKTIHGDFRNFRAPSTHVDFPFDHDLFRAISQAADDDDYEVSPLDGHDLDHGSAVPLYFLSRNGWLGSVVVLGYSFLSNEDHLSFGDCLRRASDQSGKRIALIASGDLSHRLKPEAPAGYNPGAYRFDEEVVAAIEDNNPAEIISIDPNLRRLAGECGYRSMLVAIGATQNLKPACEVLHYEAPFGVGYLVAQLTGTKSDRDREEGRRASATESGDYKLKDSTDLPALARHAVETFVLTGRKIAAPSDVADLLAARAACFVSVKTKEGDLRGCIGTVEPVQPILADELITNAISAVTRDPRFSPVTKSELPGLRYSVDVLDAPEPASFDDLDPAVYGVIVEDKAGIARGLLLPDIEGVDTASKQVEIAARKAGIPPGVPLKLSRFRVTRFREQ